MTNWMPIEMSAWNSDEPIGKESATPINAKTSTTTPILALSSREAAKALDISERTLWSLVQAGKIQSFRIGNARRYHVVELERFINERVAAEKTEEPYRHRGHDNLKRHNNAGRIAKRSKMPLK